MNQNRRGTQYVHPQTTVSSFNAILTNLRLSGFDDATHRVLIKSLRAAHPWVDKLSSERKAVLLILLYLKRLVAPDLCLLNLFSFMQSGDWCKASKELSLLLGDGVIGDTLFGLLEGETLE